jgi:hypothetical protein
MSQPWPDPIADEEALHPTDIVRVMHQEAGTLSRLIEIHIFRRSPASSTSCAVCERSPTKTARRLTTICIGIPARI